MFKDAFLLKLNIYAFNRIYSVNVFQSLQIENILRQILIKLGMTNLI